MAHTSDGKIIAPVSLNADVYPVLGLPAPSGGYHLGYACGNRHGKINKWSRRKPLRFYDIFMPTEKTGSDALNNLWGNGADVMGRAGGLISDAATPSASALRSLLRTGRIFAYQAPDGSTYPARLADFNGYVHTTDYVLTGTGPFTVALNYDEFLGGEINISLTLGVAGSYLLSPSLLIGASHRIGLLITRENGDTSLNNGYQLDGEDYLLITTQYGLSHYTAAVAGSTPGASDWGGLLTVYRADEYHYSITLRLPQKTEVQSSVSAFDDFIGRKVSLYPILVSDGGFCFMEPDTGSSSYMVSLLGTDRSTYGGYSFTLREAEAEDYGYKAPSVTFSCVIAKADGTHISIGNLLAKFTATAGQPLRYLITIKSISYSVSYYAGTQGGWQPDIEYGTIGLDSGQALPLEPGGTVSWSQTGGTVATINHQAAKYLVHLTITYEVSFTISTGQAVTKTHYIDYEQEI